MRREPPTRLRVLAQVNGVDVRAMRSLIAPRIHRLSKVAAQRVTTIDLESKEIGGKGAAEAVAAMLLWIAPTMIKLDLRFKLIRPKPLLFLC